MKICPRVFAVCRFLVAIGCLSLSGVALADEAVSYNRDVRPLLAAKCFACHGPDEDAREADLRLDSFAGATADLGDYRAIEPGDPSASELIRRVTSDDPDVAMPPNSENALSAAEVDVLRRWIASGGQYERHWAFVPPELPKIPPVKNSQWPKNAIDRFVLWRLETEGLSPSAEADAYTLVRRVYLDLIGLQPTPEQADQFVQAALGDPEAAYRELVDELLDSPHYGERWARLWLDLARYADTNGYEKDRPRSIWPFRDWVINAINEDMPFDQFTIEQLAGDMLPDATVQQRIATGFHRNTMLNEEGGIDPLEYRYYAMVDRVATTGTVWLGLTTGCCQCHTHKFDPLTHTDYYRFMALLNNADEPDLLVPDASVENRRREIERQIAKLEAELPAAFPPAEGEGSEADRRRKNLDAHFSEWVTAQHAAATDWKVLVPREMKTNLPRLEVLDDGSIFSTGDITKRDVFTLSFHTDKPITALRLEVLPDDRLPARGPGRAYYEGRKGDFFLSEWTASVDGKPRQFSDASHSYGKISIGSGNANATNVIDGDGSTGWSTSGHEGQANQLVLNLAEPIEGGRELVVELLFERHFAASLGRFRLSATGMEGTAEAKQWPVEIERLLARQPDTWSVIDRKTVRRHFLKVTPQLAEARKRIDALRKKMPQPPTTMVMLERPADNPRKTFRHHRGEYLQPKEQVTPAIPEIFRPNGQDAALPGNRLEFAQWLVSKANPLTARVTVNRAWQAFFGEGMVRTSGDFGTQSDPPTHPDLLDWLAIEFVENDWSMKRLHRMIVTSATYRQRSHVPQDLLRRDPDNRLLARGPRLRVGAEMVRDIALQASGLRSKKIGGPSVYPPQPASVTALAYGNTAWKPAAGEDRYRRSLYTFGKRTAPFAAYTVFDGPTGENCVVRRDRSNTPLQALTMLNDEMFLELTRATAAKAVKKSPRDARQIAIEIFRRFVTRPPTDDELAVLLKFQRTQQARLEDGDLDPVAIGGESADAKLAAWAMLARAILNLDETITKQ